MSSGGKSSSGSDAVPPEASGRASGDPGFEEYPLTRQEYIQAMVHLYRGEIFRSNIWRQRLDQTSNWAILAVAGMVTFTFSEPTRGAYLLLLSNLVVLGFLFIEARRFRYFAAYRARVRMLEENFYIPIVTRKLDSPQKDWREWVAMDLDVPKFKSTFLESLAFRLSYVYAYIFGGILVTWVLKIYLHPEACQNLAEFYARIRIGNVPSWVVLGLGGLFYFCLTVLLFWSKGAHKGEDEIHGLEKDLDHWKI